MKISYPGIGGSLGECVVCGESFALEVMLGRSVRMVGIGGFDRALPVHDPKCIDALKQAGNDWKAIPKGPLRDEFERATEGDQS